MPLRRLLRIDVNRGPCNIMLIAIFFFIMRSVSVQSTPGLAINLEPSPTPIVATPIPNCKGLSTPARIV